MTGIRSHMDLSVHFRQVLLDTTDSYTCSFTEFFPFCSSLYYFSSFKDFNTSSRN